MDQTWFKLEKEGVYYGQCFFICGKDHAYMPIVIRAVSREKYNMASRGEAEILGRGVARAAAAESR